MSVSVGDMLRMQAALQERYKDKWGGLSPENGRDCILWAIIEAGEAADIIKKKGDEAIVSDEEHRHDFAEEIADTLMYLMDALNCYGITAEEFSEIYRKKFERNMTRW